MARRVGTLCRREGCSSTRLAKIVTLDKSIDNLGSTVSPPSPRGRFIREVIAAFERADIEFVLLHDHDPEAPDSSIQRAGVLLDGGRPL